MIDLTIGAVLNMPPVAENWDSYGGPAIGHRLKSPVAATLRVVLPDDAPVPSVGYTGRGGIQLDWELPDKDVEIEFLPDMTVEILVVVNGEVVKDVQYEMASWDKLRPELESIFNE